MAELKTQIHASCAAFGEHAVLIRGPSGSGKSELVLRLIDTEGYGLANHAHRASLVADDQVLLTRRENKIYAAPVPALAGLLEIRGLGIMSLNFSQDIHLALIVDLVPAAHVPRLPEFQDQSTEILGLIIPRLLLDGHAVATPAIVRSKCFSSGVKTR